MKLEHRIAARYLKSRNRNSLLSFLSIISIVGIVLGVATLIVVISVLTGFTNNLKDKLLGTSSDMLITRFDSIPIDNYEKVITDVETYKGVEKVTPFIMMQGLLSSNNNVTGAIVKGIDPKREAEVSKLGTFMIDSTLDVLNDNINNVPTIILGIDLAKTLDVEIGDELSLISPSSAKRGPFGLTSKMKKFIVIGVFDTGLGEYNSGFAYTNINALMNFNKMQNTATGLSVKTTKGYDVNKLALEVGSGIGYPYWVRDWISMNKSLFSALELEKYAMFIVLTLIIVVASFNIVSMIAITVKDKRKDIAILKSFGASTKFIRRIFIFQGVVVGVLGTVIGNLLALTISVILKYSNIIKIPKNVYFSDTIPIEIDFVVYIIVTVAAFTITLVASIFPSHMAAKIGVTESLRKN